MYDPLNVYRGKYKDFIESIIRERPLNEVQDYNECHHVIPKCVKGTDDDNNLFLNLTPREHFIAHKLLSQENPDNHRLLYAWNLLCNYRPDEVTPEEYEEVKTKFREMLSSEMKGNSRGCKSRSALTRQRLSESKLGPNNPNYGKTLSEETRKKISDSMKEYGGHLHTEETKRIIGLKSSARRFDKHCPICDRDFVARSNRTKYCDECHSLYQTEISHGVFAE